MNNLNTYIIEDKSTKLADSLGLKSIEFTENLINDEAIDEWLVNIVFGLNPNIKKLIIPIRLGSNDSEYIGLRIGLHIRLTKRLNSYRFIPLIFVSVGEFIEEIIGNQIQNQILLSSLVLFTKGCAFVDFFDLERVIEEFDESLNEESLLKNVFPKLIIPNERAFGHQLANEWGVFRLAKFAGITLKTARLPSDLYFKYQFAKTDMNLIPVGKSKIGLLQETCSALLIDDYAENGWSECIEHVLKSNISQFKSKLKVITTFKDAIDYLDYENTDVVFLDLRLKSIEDKTSEALPIEEISGYKILKLIKSLNRGIQVIILTASNKAWNMKKLLDEGADGYFIKESPEFPTIDQISEDNFKSLVHTIKEAFERRYLKDLFVEIKRINEFLDKTNNVDKFSRDFLDELKNQILISFELHYYAKTKEQFAYAFITLYMVVERINKEFVDCTGENENKEWFVGSLKLKNWEWRDGRYLINNQIEFVVGNKPPEWKKVVGFCKQFHENIDSDDDKIRPIYDLINLRNYFIHNDDKLYSPKYEDKIQHTPKIFTKIGFQELFNVLRQIISFFH